MPKGPDEKEWLTKNSHMLFWEGTFELGEHKNQEVIERPVLIAKKQTLQDWEWGLKQTNEYTAHL